MKWIVLGAIVGLTLFVGSFWYMWYLAFGRAVCTGVNPWAAIGLTLFATGMMYAFISAMDWVNDWITARAVSQNSKAAYNNLKDQYSTLAAQARTMSALTRTQQQIPGPQQLPGGLVYEEGSFISDEYE